MLRPPCRSELSKLHAEQLKIVKTATNMCNKPPTLLQFRHWIVEIQYVFRHFIQDYNVIKACFWHNFKNNYLDSACAAALFYLTVC